MRRGPNGRTAIEKIRERSTQQGECLIWTGGTRGAGYGVTWEAGQPGHRIATHRAVWIDAHGPIPEGQCVCHTCDTPLCCNIDHLFLADHAGNMADRTAKGRTHRPASSDRRYWTSRVLTDDEVVEIRKLYGKPSGKPGPKPGGGVTLGSLAERFHTTPSNISAIVNGRSWK